MHFKLSIFTLVVLCAGYKLTSDVKGVSANFTKIVRIASPMCLPLPLWQCGGPYPCNGRVCHYLALQCSLCSDKGDSLKLRHCDSGWCFQVFRDRVGEGDGGFWYESRDFSQSEHRWVWFLGGQSSYLFTQRHVPSVSSKFEANFEIFTVIFSNYAWWQSVFHAILRQILKYFLCAFFQLCLVVDFICIYYILFHPVVHAILWQILKYFQLCLGAEFISFFPAALTWMLQPTFQRASGGLVFLLRVLQV